MSASELFMDGLGFAFNYSILDETVAFEIKQLRSLLLNILVVENSFKERLGLIQFVAFTLLLSSF